MLKHMLEGKSFSFEGKPFRPMGGLGKLIEARSVCRRGGP
jgi:hypothetical protein